METLGGKGKCPCCNTSFGGAVGLTSGFEVKPKTVVICFNCLEILWYNDNLKLVKPDPEDLIKIKASNSWPLIQRVIPLMIRAKGLKSEGI